MLSQLILESRGEKNMVRQSRVAELGKKWRQPRRPKTLGRPGGRPTKYRPIDHCQAIWEHLAAGHTIESLGAVIGVSKETIFEWLAVHKEFAEARELGELARSHLTEKIGLQQAVTGRGNYSTWMIFAHRYLGWTPVSQNMTHSGSVNGSFAFNMTSTTPEEKQQRISELIAKREATPTIESLNYKPLQELNDEPDRE